jgi:CRP/FNR family transcriptional regulator, cyclic AMP receptor protein
MQRASRRSDPLPLVTPVRSDHAIVVQGRPAPGLWIVETGILRMSTVRADGHELVLDLLGPGDVVGAPPDVVARATITAIRPVRLRLVTERTAAGPLAERAERMAALASDLAWLGVADRIERRLRDLAARFGWPVPGGVGIPFALPQSELASLAGTSRESANRALRTLIGEGRVGNPRRGRYVVLRAHVGADRSP